MCGVVGVFGPSALRMKDGVRQAIKTIAHRGPDGEGIYESPNGKCVLGHVRLAILDLSDAASQPMCKQKSALTYNGEIYNHNSLRPGLEKMGWEFSSGSDTETLFAGLKLNGESFLDKASGMFAGGWYDEQTDRLTLFRDPLGIKPLYLVILPDSTVIFASEIIAILTVSEQVSREIQKKALHCYLRYENYPQKETLLKSVKSLSPGEVLLYSLDISQAESKSVFKSNSEESLDLPESDLIQQTQQVIEKVVQSHLLSDVPIGVYLSGGLDSSLVACMAARHINGLTAFTGYFEDTDSYYDERPFSRDVARHINISLDEVCIRPEDFKNHFDEMIAHLGQPRMGMGAFSQFMVAKQAGQHRKVLLSGHGGDELFAGYPIFKAAWLAQNNWVSPACWKVLAKLKRKEIPWVAYMAFETFTKGITPLAPALISDNNLPSNETMEATFVDKSNNPLSCLQEYYQTIYLPGLLLVEDCISMAHSLETRVPLWSPELIRWSNRIELEKKIPKGQLKGLLREVARGVIPDSLLNAPKRGFPTPLRKWFRKYLLEFVRSRLLSTSPILDLVMSLKQREKLIQSHCRYMLPFAMDERRSHRIWILLCLESWARQNNVYHEN
jgi:asparagine synthase (glutamine-hydrolysing)